MPIPDPWQNRLRAAPRPDVEYADLIAAVRDLQEQLAAANPPQEVAGEVGAEVAKLAARLAEFAVPEEKAPIGRLPELPGRGHPLLPPFVADVATDTYVRGRVVLGRYYLGGNGAAHGGVLPLLFDEVLGHLSNANREIARTAYLHVNYRHITPVERELTLEATFEREEGRKRWVTGRLSDGDTLVADAEGLFVRLNPGQP